jgi:hypothetical protein
MTDAYAHDGCEGRFEWTGVTFSATGCCEFSCSHCGAEPQGLQAWMPPEWYGPLGPCDDGLEVSR